MDIHLKNNGNCDAIATIDLIDPDGLLNAGWEFEINEREISVEKNRENIVKAILRIPKNASYGKSRVELLVEMVPENGFDSKEYAALPISIIVSEQNSDSKGDRINNEKSESTPGFNPILLWIAIVATILIIKYK